MLSLHHNKHLSRHGDTFTQRTFYLCNHGVELQRKWVRAEAREFAVSSETKQIRQTVNEGEVSHIIAWIINGIGQICIFNEENIYEWRN